MERIFNNIVKAASKKFPDKSTSEKLLDNARWPHGRRCAYCDSSNVSDNYMRYDRDYYCKFCGSFFNLKINTFLHNSKLTDQQWGMFIYISLAFPESHQYPEIYDELIAKAINVSPVTIPRVREIINKAMALDVPLYPFGSLFKKYLPSV